MSFKETLKGFGASEEEIRWAGDMSIAQVWATCERGDWMLWLASKLHIDMRVLTAAKAECAALAMPYMKDYRSIAAVSAARAYARGEISEGELSAAAAAAYAAYAPDATYAAYTADAYAADAAYAAAYAAYATYAAYAAYSAAAAAYDDAKKDEILKQCAHIVRNIITLDMITSQL